MGLKNNEMHPLINSNYSNNPNNVNHDNEPTTISSKVKRLVDRFQIMPPSSSLSSPSKASAIFHQNHNRKRSTINLRSRDYKTDASGKKGFKVKIPMKIVFYFTIVFILVPLLIAFGILVRIFFFKGSRGRIRGGNNVHSKDLIIGEDDGTIEDAAKNQLRSPSNPFEGGIRGEEGDAVIYSSLGNKDGIIADGGKIGIATGMTADHVGSGVDYGAETDKAMKLLNDTAPALEQQQQQQLRQGVEGSLEDLADAASNADERLPHVDEHSVGIDTNSVSGRTGIEQDPKAEPVEHEEESGVSVVDSSKR